MIADDKDALYDFFNLVPPDEILYLRDDVHNRAVMEKWAQKLDYSRILPLVALKDGMIVGEIILYRRPFGWKRHLGDIRLFVHKDFRKVGLGSLMIEEVVDIAFDLGLKKLLAEVPAHNRAAMNACRRAGFRRAAVIPDLVMDSHDQFVDMVIMIRDLELATEDEIYHF